MTSVKVEDWAGGSVQYGSDALKTDLVLLEIFSLLDTANILSCRRVCRKWNVIAESVLAKKCVAFVSGSRLEEYLKFEKERENIPSGGCWFKRYFLTIHGTRWAGTLIDFLTAPWSGRIEELSVVLSSDYWLSNGGTGSEVSWNPVLDVILKLLPRLKKLQLLRGERGNEIAGNRMMYPPDLSSLSCIRTVMKTTQKMAKLQGLSTVSALEKCTIDFIGEFQNYRSDWWKFLKRCPKLQELKIVSLPSSQNWVQDFEYYYTGQHISKLSLKQVKVQYMVDSLFGDQSITNYVAGIATLLNSLPLVELVVGGMFPLRDAKLLLASLKVSTLKKLTLEVRSENGMEFMDCRSILIILKKNFSALIFIELSLHFYNSQRFLNPNLKTLCDIQIIARVHNHSKLEIFTRIWNAQVVSTNSLRYAKLFLENIRLIAPDAIHLYVRSRSKHYCLLKHALIGAKSLTRLQHLSLNITIHSNQILDVFYGSSGDAHYNGLLDLPGLLELDLRVIPLKNQAPPLSWDLLLRLGYFLPAIRVLRLDTKSISKVQASNFVLSVLRTRYETVEKTDLLTKFPKASW